MIKVICAWCGKDMGEKDGEGVEGVSHGICPACLTEVIDEASAMRNEIKQEMELGEGKVKKS